MKRLFLALMLLSEPALAEDVPCPQIDLAKRDTDGMPWCPDAVKENSAFAVYRCALKQAKSFHNPTAQEKADMGALISTWKDIREKGKSPERAAGYLARAAKLNLQACRVKDGGDSYLVTYVKPGIKNYSGPFLLLRETRASRFVVLSPHDDTDSTHSSSKLALQKTHALAVVSNGHLRGNIPLGSSQPVGSSPDSRGGKGDWSHETETINLGTYTVRLISEAYPKRIWLMVHGMSNDQSILYRIRNPSQNIALRTAYEKATAAATGMTNFNRSFNADFHTDKYMSNQYIKVEYPAKIHRNRQMHLATAIADMEGYAWAWDDAPVPEETAPPEPEPSPVPEEELEEEEQDPDLEGPPDECGGHEESPEPEPTPELEVPPTPVPTPAPVNWKPQRKSAKGKRDLVCVAVKYASGPSATQSKCASVARSVATFYKNQSRGRLEFTPKAVTYQSNLGAGHKGAGQAADWARKKYPNALIILPNVNWYKGPSHAGMRVAWLHNYGSANHEVGHLIGLGHCGRYQGYNPETGYLGKLDHYGGGGCIMSGLAGSHLDPGQYVHLDWLNDDELAIYDGIGVKEYTLRKISAIQGKENLMTVAVPPVLFSGDPKARPLYIAYSDKCNNEPCMAIYLESGGGSQRIGVFGKKFSHAPSGLLVKNLGGDSTKLKISVEIAKSPM